MPLYTIDTENASDFLCVVRQPSSRLLPTGYCYRGQRDADWGLVVSARRARAWASLGGAEAWGLKVRDEEVLGSRESLESVLAELGRMLADVVAQLKRPPELMEPDNLAALAQHIGLPTILLDWTRSPECAAYFAAAGALEAMTKSAGGHEEKRLSVFVIPTGYLAEKDLPTDYNAEEDLRGSWISPSHSGNKNLEAQQGRLLRVDAARDLIRGLPRKPYPDAPNMGEQRNIICSLARVTAPWTAASEILRSLRTAGVHGGTLFPGDVGIAQYVRELAWTKRQAVTGD